MLHTLLLCHRVLTFSLLLPRVRIYPFDIYELLKPLSPLTCKATKLYRRNRQPWGDWYFSEEGFISCDETIALVPIPSEGESIAQTSSTLLAQTIFLLTFLYAEVKCPPLFLQGNEGKYQQTPPGTSILMFFQLRCRLLCCTDLLSIFVRCFLSLFWHFTNICIYLIEQKLYFLLCSILSAFLCVLSQLSSLQKHDVVKKTPLLLVVSNALW